MSYRSQRVKAEGRKPSSLQIRLEDDKDLKR